MAPVLKRFMRLSTDSTSSIGIDSPCLNSSRPRSVERFFARSSISSAYDLYVAYELLRTDFCRRWMRLRD